MYAITWIPGSDSKLDSIFDSLRDEQYQDRAHRLWENYSKENFNFAVALTIYFENDVPLLCSSIASRPCWPENIYRILNRTWKPANRLTWPNGVGQNWAITLSSQINWLKENTECKLYFISRQKAGWEDWCIRSFKKHGLEFKTDNYKYLTCPNECDSTCWQKIIYNGSEELLSQWNRQQNKL